VKFLVREAARERRIPVIMETSDRGSWTWSVSTLSRIVRSSTACSPILMRRNSLDSRSPRRARTWRRLMGVREVSSRAAASFSKSANRSPVAPIGQRDHLGAATVAAAVRRLGMNGNLPSGRVRFDVEEILSNLAEIALDTQLIKDLASPPPWDRRSRTRAGSDDRRCGAARAVGREHATLAIRGGRRRGADLPSA